MCLLFQRNLFVLAKLGIFWLIKDNKIYYFRLSNFKPF